MDAALRNRFAENLKRIRATTSWTQEELALRADMHRTRISKFEKGEELPQFETLVRLAGALGVSIEVFAEGIAWEPTVSTPGGMQVADTE